VVGESMKPREDRIPKERLTIATPVNLRSRWGWDDQDEINKTYNFNKRGLITSFIEKHGR
jgi:hypothetical protein